MPPSPPSTALARAPALALVDLVLPRRCAGCRRAGPALCTGCSAVLVAGAEQVPASWLAAGAPTTTSAGPYRGRVRATVLAWKGGRHDLTPVLGAVLAGAVVLALERADGGPARGTAGPAARVVLVPVPSSRTARRERGAALTEDLASACARVLIATGTETVTTAPRSSLVLTRLPRDQIGLGAAARAANLRGAHRAAPGLRGLRCVLVDDVVTTGATLGEAARAIRACGGRVVAAVTLAATAAPGS